MKITSVECYLDDFITIKVNTDEGISGFGEASMSYGAGSRAAFGQCQDFAKLVIGMDPFNTEEIWEHLFRHTFWGMGGGASVGSAMAAIDIACWDIKGKALGLPVYKLLGGRTNKKLRAYASQIQFGWRKVIAKHTSIALLFEPQEYYDAVKDAMADGYDAIKVDPVYAPAKRCPREEVFATQGTYVLGTFPQEQLKIAEERMAAVREAAGPDVDIILESHALVDANTAPVLAKALEKHRILYFEEPAMPCNPGVFRDIKERCSLPLATGERSYTRWGFRQFLEERTLDIVQPDVTSSGGITEAKKICDMAQVYDIGAQLHVCGGPIATAAALQVEAVIPNFVIHEENWTNLTAWYKRAGKYAWEPCNGCYEMNDRPGIGQEMSQEVMDHPREKVVIE